MQLKLFFCLHIYAVNSKLFLSPLHLLPETSLELFRVGSYPSELLMWTSIMEFNDHTICMCIHY